MKRLAFGLFITIAVLSFILVQNIGHGSEGIIECTVETPSLFVSVSAPARVRQSNTFTVSAVVRNNSSHSVLNTVAEIFLPQGLSLPPKENSSKSLGTLSAFGEKTASWKVKASKRGNYIILVQATGQDGNTGMTLIGEGTTLVEVYVGK